MSYSKNADLVRAYGGNEEEAKKLDTAVQILIDAAEEMKNRYPAPNKYVISGIDSLREARVTIEHIFAQH